MKILIIGALFFATYSAVYADVLSVPEKYQSGVPVKILIVPGHDDEFSGAQFRGVREADLTLALAKKIRDDLANDSNISVALSRNDVMYTPELTDYFKNKSSNIASFIKNHAQDTRAAIAAGEIAVSSQVPHANANDVTVTRLYGINKWAAEQNFDLILHIHFNDYYPRPLSKPGDYFGYTVYVPDSQLPNARPAKPFGESVAKRIGQIFPRSSMPLEQKMSDEFGVVPDLKLIALGANRTLMIPSILVEYAYIYEPQVTVPLFSQTSQVYAQATATGITDYLSGTVSNKHSASFHFDTDLESSQNKKPDALMLQLVLAEMGLYPPKPKTTTDCPFTGVFGSCTKSSIESFQKKFYLSVDGLFGKKTRAAINGVLLEGN